MPKNTIQPMRVEVFDDDFIGKDHIGYVNIDFLSALENPSKWAINNVYDLDGDAEMRSKYATEKFGKIYLQIMFVPEGIINTDLPLPLLEDMDEITRKKKEIAKIPMRGTIVINVVMAQNLKKADKDGSDPYVEITFPDKKQASSQAIPLTLNPIWNFQHRHRIDIYQEVPTAHPLTSLTSLSPPQAYTPLILKVFDKDALAIDDLLGTARIEWQDCFNNPSKVERERRHSSVILTVCF